MELHVEIFSPLVELGIAREGHSGLIVRHDAGNWGPVQLFFGKEGTEPLQMKVALYCPMYSA
jgi:hypothetical protein